MHPLKCVIEIVTFFTSRAHYPLKWLVMPFDLTNASSTFTRLINNILRELISGAFLVLFHYILIYSKTLKTCLVTFLFPVFHFLFLVPIGVDALNLVIL